MFVKPNKKHCQTNDRNVVPLFSIFLLTDITRIHQMNLCLIFYKGSLPIQKGIKLHVMFTKLIELFPAGYMYWKGGIEIIFSLFKARNSATV